MTRDLSKPRLSVFYTTLAVGRRENNQCQIDGSQPDGNTLIRPGTCSINCSNDNEVYSFHTGGAMIVMADGSVRFVSKSIAIDQLVALASRNGQEVISSE